MAVVLLEEREFRLQKWNNKMIRWLNLWGLLFLIVGCSTGTQTQEVIVYVALDREFSEPVLKRFEQETGIRVRAKYDIESNKTVGLANELIESAGRGRADLFWNNEVLHTLRLERAGRLAAYSSPRAAEYPESFRSPDGKWYGFAARARVLIVNTDLLPDATQHPNSIRDLIDPRWKGNCGMAKPFFGTTATQAAVIFSEWPTEEAVEFFKKAAENAQQESGNKTVARNVSAGRYAWGLTDTDDAIIELEKGQPVAIVYPDQQPSSAGTLLIPNTLGILADAPNPQAAQRLVDFLLSAEIERMLCECPSAQLPLNSNNAATVSRVAIENMRVQQVDFAEAAKSWDDATRELSSIFQ